MIKITLIIVFALILLNLFFNTNRYKRWFKKTNNFLSFFSSQNKQKVNPDMDTDNWELHKLRLEKFRRSQYKGVTFFVSSDHRIYYLSEKSTKVYC